MMDTKPISKHDASKKYLEYYAKMLLETLMPDRYQGIMPWEGPDFLMNDHYGIEVTWAMFDNQGLANGLLNYTQGKRMDELNKGVQRNLTNSPSRQQHCRNTRDLR